MRAPCDRRVAVVMITRDRVEEALRDPGVAALPERPAVVVVDDGSSDGTPERVRTRLPEVEVLPLASNLGAAGRNLGMDRVAAPTSPSATTTPGRRPARSPGPQTCSTPTRPWPW